MKTTMRTILATAILAGATTAPAWAATGRTDTSGILVWVFLGFCALIIMAQAVPALIMAVLAAKGVAEGLRERKTVTAETE